MTLAVQFRDAGADEPVFRPRTHVSLNGGRWFINGDVVFPGGRAEGLLMNVRMVNAVFEDAGRSDFDPEANTDELIRRIPEYSTSGVRAFTVGLQGGMPGYEGAKNSAFEADGALRPAYLARVRRMIEACDAGGLVVILGCFYQRQDQVLRDDEAVKAGVVNVARWIKNSGFANVVLEIANEFPHSGFDRPILRSSAGEAELVRLARQSAPGLLVSTSGMGDGRLAEVVAKECDFLLIHFNGVPAEQIPARIAELRKFNRPIVCNEDDKRGELAVRAAELSVAGGASWGLMLEQHNQHFPFEFLGAADDPVVYVKLRQLASPFPGQTWRRQAPAEAGLDSRRLETFRKFVGGRVCIVRHGVLVDSWGDITRRGDVASAAKTIYAHFLARALELEKIASFDEPVVKWEPRLEPLNEKLNFKDRRITWRHLINQTSCYGVREIPGEAFDYSDFNMALLFDTLFLRAYGKTYQTVDELLRTDLAERLKCEDGPTFMAFGAGNRPGRLAMSPRDMARFGLLYLHRGHWQRDSVLDENLVDQLLGSPRPGAFPRTRGEPEEMIPGQRSIGGGNNQTDHLGSYSFAWWTNGTDRTGMRHWPDAPTDTFAALGHGGERALFVIPSLDLVISWNDSPLEGRDRQNQALRLLIESVERND